MSDALQAPLRYWASRAEDRPFLTLIDSDEGPRSLSYGELYERVRRLAAGLAAAGLRPGDRCVVHTGNGLGFMLAFFAVQEAGAVAVPTIDQYSAEELGFVVRHCRAWGAIASPRLLEVARQALAGGDCRLLVAGTDPRGEALALDELLAAAEPAPSPPRPAQAPAMILYTSGTTSHPKGVMLGAAGSLYTATSYANQLRLRGEDVVLTCMPLFHVNGMFLQLASTLVAGARFVLAERFSASRYWSWLSEHGVTVAHLVAGPIRLLLGAAPKPPAHRVRAMTFGLPLADAEIAEFEARFGIPLRMVWGSTETCCGGTMMPLDFGARPGLQQIGPAMLGWEVRAVREDFSDCGPGEVGELVVRSPGVMLGYYRDPEASAEALHEGWVRTGDLGRRDEDGYFEFVDRIKDMLKPSGENVAASEVERVLLAAPGVRECAVVGVPDPVRTELVVAVVVADPGAPPTATELIAHCRRRLAAFKVPAAIVFRDRLPKTSIGKVRKGELRADLAHLSRSAPAARRHPA